MDLIPWAHRGSTGATLRGWHSPPSGRSVLHFLHGNGFSSRTYEPLLQALSTRFDLWLCDIHGHGASDAGPSFPGWNRTAEEVAQAFDAGRKVFGAAPCHAVGHSLGGVLSALILAERPTLFSRAVLLDPVLFSPTMIGLMAFSDVVGLYRRNKLASRARRRRRHWPDRDAAMDALRGRGMFAGWQEDALRAYANFALREDEDGVVLCCAPEREAAIFASFPRRMWPSLVRVETPTHVLAGERSYPFVLQATDRWCATNAQVTRDIVPGGHCFMQEAPAESAAKIAAFLTR